MKQRHWLQTAALAVACAWPLGLTAADPAPATAPAAAAAEAPAASAEDAFSFFLQEAEVVTASRRAQKKSDSPVAIDVITREEIEKSGAMDLWDLLRFRVGLDVANASSIEGQPAQVNVRGLNNEFSQSLQVLVDGRSVVSALNSGVFWRNLPIVLDDVERIEIVRGPNSALFGANAGQGVINIITRKPGSGGSAHMEAGEYGFMRGTFIGDFSGEGKGLRVTLSEAKRSSFPLANGDVPSSGDARPMDRRLSLRAEMPLWSGATAELFGGVGERSFQVPNALGVNSGAFRGHYAMAQVRQTLDDHAIEVMASRREDNNTFGPANSRETVSDVDALARLSAMDGDSLLTLGGSQRHALVDSVFYFNYNGSPQGAYRESYYRRLYAHEAFKVNDLLSLALAGSYEASDIGGQWPAYQGAVIFKPLDGHSLRLSGSKSPTLPSMSNKFSQIFINSGGPDFTSNPGFVTLPGFFVEGTDVSPAQVASYEATWSSALLDRKVLAELTAFQMEVDGLPQILIGSTIKSQLTGGNSGAPFFLPFLNAGPLGHHRNSMNFVLRGVETVLTYRPVNGTSIQVNHTYEDVYSSIADGAFDNVTPWNKLNLIVHSELGLGFNGSCQVGWVGKHRSFQGSRSTGAWIEDGAKVDLRLGYKPHADLEVFAVAANLADERRVESVDSMTQPQMYWGGVNVAFGGK